MAWDADRRPSGLPIARHVRSPGRLGGDARRLFEASGAHSEPFEQTTAGGRGVGSLMADSRRQAVVQAVAAVRSTDPGRVETAVSELSGRRRWLRPLVYAAGTIAVVFDGVRLLIQNWRLTLLQLAPAVWIWVMSWNLRTHALSKQGLPTDRVGLIAAGVIIAAQVTYWCNATFAFALLQGTKTDLMAAFREARSHWRFVGGLALLTGGLQAAVWLFLPTWRLAWFWMALLVMFVVQIYLFVAVPAWLIGVRKTGGRRDRAMQSLTTGVLSGVASTPGFLLNRLGLLLVGIGPVGALGFGVVAIGAVLHATASSSVRVVKMSVRLRGAEERAAPTSPSTTDPQPPVAGAPLQ